MSGLEEQSWWLPFALILLLGMLPTEIWRWLAVILGSRIDPNGAFFEWVKAVATGLIAAIIAQVILFPNGTLADIPLWVRIVSTLCGFGSFLLVRQNIIVGVLAGVGCLYVLTLFFGFNYHP